MYIHTHIYTYRNIYLRSSLLVSIIKCYSDLTLFYCATEIIMYIIMYFFVAMSGAYSHSLLLLKGLLIY